MELVLGICGSNNGTWRNTQPIIPGYQETIWRHWVYVGGAFLKNGKKTLCILNSWGKNFGDDGWQFINEDYLLGRTKSGPNLFGAWTLVYNTNTPPPPMFNASFNMNVQYGDYNPEVKKIQSALQSLGHFPPNIAPTGYYGTITGNAVYKFQFENGIVPPARNNVGPKTRQSLNTRFNQKVDS